MTFTDKLAPFAVKHGLANGVLPSLIIAQGVLESASGTSELAVKANNLFGIKAGSGWNGQIYTKRTAEQKSDGAVFYIDAEFRSYPSYEGCVIDLVHKYTHGTGWESHNRYAAVLNQIDFRKATAAVKAAGYATDVNYPNKLNQIIEKYGLAKYDKGDDQVAKIYIDPGHGAHDPGAVGKRSNEKDNVLKVGLRLKALLEAAGHTVKMSRSTDVFLTLSERARLANRWGADYFISLHNNAATSNASGFETFIYNGTVSAATSKLQAAIHNVIAKEIGIRDRGMKRKNLAVLRESNMPAVLIEYAFISNTNDENILINEVEKLAQLTAKGIVAIAGGKLPVETEKVAAEPKKEGANKVWVEFSSAALKKEFETFLGSKAQQDIAVKAGVNQGYSKTWPDNDKATPGDKAMLGLGATIKQNK